MAKIGQIETKVGQNMQIDAIITRCDHNEVRISVSNGKLQVSAPFEMSDDCLRNILEKNASWIRQKMQSASVEGETKTDKPIWGNVELASEMFSYKKVMLAGKIFHVVVGECVKAYLEGDKIVINERAFRDVSGRKKAVESFLKTIAKQCLRQEISQFGTSIALCPAAINVTRIKNSGWIRCADMANKVVSIDYRVVQLPFELRNYLIAHVFSHFFQPGHDGNFFRVLSNYLPNFEQLQCKLDKYSFLKEIG